MNEACTSLNVKRWLNITTVGPIRLDNSEVIYPHQETMIGSQLFNKIKIQKSKKMELPKLIIFFISYLKKMNEILFLAYKYAKNSSIGAFELRHMINQKCFCRIFEYQPFLPWCEGVNLFSKFLTFLYLQLLNFSFKLTKWCIKYVDFRVIYRALELEI